MDGDDGGPDFAFMAAPPGRISLSRFSSLLSPAPRRLSSCFSEPSRALPTARKKLAWVSLQGRLVGAEEAASARTIGGGLSPEEAVAWELFTPLQRVLLIAIVAAAGSESKKSRRIAQLQNSVDLRDKVLLDMQQKLDDLCEQLNSLNDQARDHGGKVSAMNDGSSGDELVEAEGMTCHSCDHQVHQLNPQSGIVPLETIFRMRKGWLPNPILEKVTCFSSLTWPSKRSAECLIYLTFAQVSHLPWISSFLHLLKSKTSIISAKSVKQRMTS